MAYSNERPESGERDHPEPGTTFPEDPSGQAEAEAEADDERGYDPAARDPMRYGEGGTVVLKGDE